METYKMEDIKYDCNFCKDTKHLLKNDVWIRCLCLKKDIEQQKYIMAGISIKSEDLGLDNINSKFTYFPISSVLLDLLKNLEKQFKKNKKPARLACIQGVSIGPKDVVVQTLLKSAVDSGFKVRQYSMEELISLFFKEDDYNGLEEDFKNYDVFSLYFGSEIQHNVGAAFLQELVRYSYKHNVYLLLNTSLNFGGLKLKYDENIEKLFLRLGAGTDSFDKRIVFIPLEE